jgi:hypothetical protein
VQPGTSGRGGASRAARSPTQTCPRTKTPSASLWRCRTVHSWGRLVAVRIGGFLVLASIAAGACADGGSPSPAVPPTAASEPSVLAAADLPCSGSASQPPSDFTVLFDSVALPAAGTFPAALQTSEREGGVQTRLFAKIGLWFRPGRSFEISVPAELHDVVALDWGVPAEPAWSVSTGDCGFPDADQWVVIPGGYLVADPICASVVVRSGETEELVKIGLGKACPGQAPPPEPSDDYQTRRVAGRSVLLRSGVGLRRREDHRNRACPR